MLPGQRRVSDGAERIQIRPMVDRELLQHLRCHAEGRPDHIARCAEWGERTEIDELVPIHTYLASPGGTSETITLFCARFDSSKFGGVHGLAEESEDIRSLSVPVQEAFSWISNRRITNGPSDSGQDA